MAVQVTLGANKGTSESSDGPSCSFNSVSEALALAETLARVQHETERLKAAETAAQKLASGLQVS